MVASIGCSFSGTVLLLQNHYPRFRGAPSGHFRMLTKRPPSVDLGLGASEDSTLSRTRVVAHDQSSIHDNHCALLFGYIGYRCYCLRHTLQG